METLGSRCDCCVPAPDIDYNNCVPHHTTILNYLQSTGTPPPFLAIKCWSLVNIRKQIIKSEEIF